MTEPLREALHQAVQASIDATDHEIETAIKFIAARVREELPDAKRINLEASDQGDWLTNSDIDGEEEPETLWDDLSWATSCIYTSRELDGYTGLHLNEEKSSRQAGDYYYIDIEEALA